MPKVEINTKTCKGCELCVLYCPKGCMAPSSATNEKGVKPILFSDKENKCTGCSFCAIVCPDVCITVYK